jgi:hypothetical protein
MSFPLFKKLHHYQFIEHTPSVLDVPLVHDSFNQAFTEFCHSFFACRSLIRFELTLPKRIPLLLNLDSCLFQYYLFFALATVSKYTTQIHPYREWHMGPTCHRLRRHHWRTRPWGRGAERRQGSGQRRPRQVRIMSGQSLAPCAGAVMAVGEAEPRQEVAR